MGADSVIRYVEYAIAVAVLLIVILIAILFAYYARKYIHGKRRPKLLKRPSQYTYISPNEPPDFVIPPYAAFLDEEAFEEKEENELPEPTAEGGETLRLARTASDTVVPVTGPKLLRPQLGRSVSAGSHSPDIGSGRSPGGRPQYRRAVSSLGGPLVTRKTTASRKASIAPYGKMQVSLQFVSNKNLLVIQVNGTYDLPQLRTSGVATPYVRVQLLPGNGSKDQRTSFMNLASNRICVFDRISLEEAKKSTLKFVVLDYDRFSRSEFVAEIMLPLSEVDLEDGETITRHLNSQSRPEADEDRGKLSVTLCQEPRTGHLGVNIVRADGLRTPPRMSDPNASLGTQVKVLYYVQNKLIDKRKTKLVKGTTNPVFNDPFLFEMKEEELKNSSVVCEVYQSDSKLRVEKIGHLNLGVESYGTEIRHWNEMMLQPTKQVTECHHLHL